MSGIRWMTKREAAGWLLLWLALTGLAFGPALAEWLAKLLS